MDWLRRFETRRRKMTRGEILALVGIIAAATVADWAPEAAGRPAAGGAASLFLIMLGCLALFAGWTLGGALAFSAPRAAAAAASAFTGEALRDRLGRLTSVLAGLAVFALCGLAAWALTRKMRARRCAPPQD
ncbi:hypothetical protein ACQ5SO_16445 [Rhodovulum sp. DZ06]|uniref:hypothetical protein n=1 Tax=Rhodovulum sp. DZ06 TaxID=3425126 RepID=UPI003D35990F